MNALLEVSRLEAFYGQSQVLHNINFSLMPGSITTILGANGAGKTTSLRALSGMVKTKGDIIFGGVSISGKATEEIVRFGIAHVPEGRGTFEGMSVMENLQLGAMTRKDKNGIKEDIERMFGYFPILKNRTYQQAGTLSGGEQQMLAVARALMLRPQLLLLDEPSFGLAPLLVSETLEILRRINQESKVCMLVVEQNATLALNLADYAYVLETGKVVISGTAEEIKNNESVRRSYLGY
ncbi:MAG: ABC transporter ATP-binding protein [Deltaproteobacteria bacterium]|jgi:branched-chain amino acid transport system ATP-binding protein|nr:ABC transporter ATP-binding protein [Deltaproteobacteria bacterium]MBT6501786.1 ABC transporter ATP-binding protein [Deltaproteobacteria bacterium]MBT7887589.1 ABC transporter ATP-binding protein [Deltaproteobacteria bacterium]